MSVSFGRNRSVLPPSNLGQNLVAQRRVAEASVRAAERTKIAVSVDAFPTRLYLRNPRGAIQCPCSSGQLNAPGIGDPVATTNKARVILDRGEGDDIEAVDSGYPLNPRKYNVEPGEELPPDAPEGFKSEWVDSIGHLLLGDGRRCGICWGTGWVDGHRLYGGQRVVCCVLSNPWAAVDVESSTADVDLESPTPTMVGPGIVVWDLSITPGLNLLDGIRVRDGLRPALAGWTLKAVTPEFPEGIDAATALNVSYGAVEGQCLSKEQIPTQLILTLPENVRVSHIELVLRSEPLVNMQLPALQLTASTELVAPFIQIEFELDPTVGWVERGSIAEVPGIGGRLGSVWVLSDVTENRTAAGVTWGIVGSCRNVQPNEVLACVSLEDSLLTGLQDYGLAIRGLESTGAGDPSGLYNSTDESLAAAKRGTNPRVGGGSTPGKFVGIALTPSEEW